MDWFHFLITVLRIVLVDFPSKVAWPIVALLVVYPHRSEVGDFLRRLIKIGPTGAEAIPPQISPPSLPASAQVSADKIAYDIAYQLPPSDPVISRLEMNIKNNLVIRGIDIDKIDDQRKTEIFLREYAVLVRKAHFDLITRDIFGTQIAALRQLASGTAQSRQALIPIFDDHVKRVIGKGLNPGDFNQWIAYLLSANLISVDESGLYVATDVGRQFLNVPGVNETTRAF